MSAHRRRAALASGVLVFSLLFTGSVAAQPQSVALTVRVVDPTGAAVSRARVSLRSRYSQQLPRLLETDATGGGVFERVPAGAYLLQVDATGFTRALRTIEVDASPTSIVVALSLLSVAEHVVVTAVERPQHPTEVAKAVSVIDSAEIRTRNAFVVADAIRTTPGVSVQQLGGLGSFTSIKLRGLREQDTAVLLDGVRVRDASSPQGDATAFAGELYITDLDRIEVLRGSGSSLYGSHAIGGAVNMITRSGVGRPAFEISAEAGGLGFSRAAAHMGAGALDGRLGASAGLGHTGVSRGIDGDDKAANTSVQGRIDLRLPRSAHAFVRMYGSAADSKINEPPAAIGPLPSSGVVDANQTTFVPAANDPDNERDSGFLSTLAVFEQRLSSTSGYSISFHRLRTDRTFVDGPSGASPFEPAGSTTSRFAGRLDTLDARVDRAWSAAHVTTVAYELERERYRSESVPVNRSLAWDADITQHSHAVSIRHDMRFDELHVSASVRGQRFVLQSVTLAPADRAPFAAASFAAPPSALTADLAAARWIPRTGTKLRVHAGNGYRAPAMFERAGVSFGSQGYRVFGDPGIAPERSVSIDAGADQRLLKGRMLASATWFHSRLTRVIGFRSLNRTVDPFGRSSGYAAADGRSARGVELALHVQPRQWLQARLAYTFVDAPPPVGGTDGLPRATAITAHLFSAVVLHRAGPVDISLDLHASGDHFVTLFDPVAFGSRAFRFDGVARADVSAQYHLTRGRVRSRLFMAVENVLDRTYFVQGFFAPGRLGRGGLAVRF